MINFILSRIASFRHAFRGLWYVLRTQKNAWIHAIVTAAVIVVGSWLIQTKALNRGIAEVRIDGKMVRTLDLFSAGTQWQASTTFDRLAAAPHLLELKVSGQKNAQSSGLFVDLDAIRVSP